MDVNAIDGWWIYTVLDLVGWLAGLLLCACAMGLCVCELFSETLLWEWMQALCATTMVGQRDIEAHTHTQLDETRTTHRQASRGKHTHTANRQAALCIHSSGLSVCELACQTHCLFFAIRLVCSASSTTESNSLARSLARTQPQTYTANALYTPFHCT